MTTNEIHAVLFDMGGTLEDIYYDDALRLQATPGLRQILAKYDLDPGLDPPSLYAVVKTGMDNYGVWREQTEMELPPERVWSEFVLIQQGLPAEKVAAHGEELAFYYDMNFYRRTLRPDAKAVLETLRARGFQLGVISNVYSRGTVPANLERYGLASYFSVVVMSSVLGCRKPNPQIFLEATRLLALPPSACAYVGDTVSRDVIGAHRAGYRLAIQIKSFLTTQSDRATDVEPPDAIIQTLMQVAALVNHPSESHR